MSKKESVTFESIGVHPSICSALTERGLINPFELQRRILLHTVNDFADIIAEAPTGSRRHTLLSVFAAHCILSGEPKQRNDPQQNVILVAASSSSCTKIVSTFNQLLSATRIHALPCMDDRPPKAPSSRNDPAPGCVYVGTLATLSAWAPEHFSKVITLIVEDIATNDESILHGLIENIINVAPSTNLFFLSSLPPSEVSLSVRYLLRRDNRRYYFSEAEQPRFSYLMCHDAEDRNQLNSQIAMIKGFKNILVLTHNREVRELKAQLHQDLGVKTFSIQRNTTSQDHDRVLGEFLRSQYAVLVAMDAYTGVDLMDLDAVIQFYPPQKSMPEEEWSDFVSYLQTTSDPRRPTVIVTIVAPDDFSLASYFMRRVGAEGPIINVSPNHPQFAAAVLYPQVVTLEKMKLENAPDAARSGGGAQQAAAGGGGVAASAASSNHSGGGSKASTGHSPNTHDHPSSGKSDNNHNQHFGDVPPPYSQRHLDNDRDQQRSGNSGGDVPLPRSQRNTAAAAAEQAANQGKQQQQRQGSAPPPAQQQGGNKGGNNSNNNKMSGSNNNGHHNNNSAQQQAQNNNNNYSGGGKQQQKEQPQQQQTASGGKGNNNNAAGARDQQQQDNSNNKKGGGGGGGNSNNSNANNNAGSNNNGGGGNYNNGNNNRRRY